MTTPINPSQPTPPGGPGGPQQPSSQTPSNLPTSYVDPTGAWANFLSTPNAPATAQDVQVFMNGMLKFFNVMIQQQQDAMKRALEQMKKTGQGDD